METGIIMDVHLERPTFLNIIKQDFFESHSGENVQIARRKMFQFQHFFMLFLNTFFLRGRESLDIMQNLHVLIVISTQRQGEIYTMFSQNSHGPWQGLGMPKSLSPKHCGRKHGAVILAKTTEQEEFVVFKGRYLRKALSCVHLTCWLCSIRQSKT